VLKRIIILLLCFPLIVFAKGSFTTKGLTLKKYIDYTSYVSTFGIIDGAIDYFIYSDRDIKSIGAHFLMAHASFLTHETSHVLTGLSFEETDRTVWDFEDKENYGSLIRYVSKESKFHNQLYSYSGMLANINIEPY